MNNICQHCGNLEDNHSIFCQDVRSIRRGDWVIGRDTPEDGVCKVIKVEKLHLILESPEGMVHTGAYCLASNEEILTYNG